MLTAIDQIANRSHLQMFKAAIPYFPYRQQRFLAFFIKFLELQNVLSFFSSADGRLQSGSASSGQVPLPEMLNDIRGYCDESEKGLLDQIADLLAAMELFSVLSEEFEEKDEEDYHGSESYGQ